MRLLIKGGHIVNEGRTQNGYIVIEDGVITEITKQQPVASFDETIDATGCYVLPGVIDDHVHFREPGLTQKADIDSESRAAAAGGVTTYFDMPNCVPQTTTLEALEEKFQLAAQKSHVNYSFFFGATNDNAALFAQLPENRIPGVKLFMGASTGNMLVDKQQALEHEEACLASTRKAVELAKKYGTRLHVAHISTAEELELFESNHHSQFPQITAEACLGHLYFSQLDHERLGAKIKVNPSIKTPVDQFLLREALNDGHITVVATDHAPHLLEQKQGGCVKAASGMPMIQFSLVTMLELVDNGVLSIERLVELMCHHPARLFGVERRGFLCEGYQADVVIVRPHSPWRVTKDVILSKCGWSPMEGHDYQWQVERTLCNGHTVYEKGCVDDTYIGEAVTFNHSFFNFHH